METAADTRTSFPKPLPLEDADQQPYWDAANRHELALQKCTQPAASSCTRQVPAVPGAGETS